MRHHPPKEASDSADAIVTILPDDDTVEQVAAGKDGVLEGMSEGAILVDMSTISPTMARRIAERLEANGMEMLDAPVSLPYDEVKNMSGGRMAEFGYLNYLKNNLVRRDENGAIVVEDKFGKKTTIEDM
jgi:3-hydroxyisobutyrate dehydrogenase-like beta-hydroxyacid dehydrogenase